MTDDELIAEVEKRLALPERPRRIRRGNDAYYKGEYCIIEDTQTRKSTGEVLIRVLGKSNLLDTDKWVHFSDLLHGPGSWSET